MTIIPARAARLPDLNFSAGFPVNFTDISPANTPGRA
jgi:hypothetical protein